MNVVKPEEAPTRDGVDESKAVVPVETFRNDFCWESFDALRDNDVACDEDDDEEVDEEAACVDAIVANDGKTCLKSESQMGEFVP